MLKRFINWLMGEDLDQIVHELQRLEKRFDAVIKQLQRDQVVCQNLLDYHQTQTRELKARIESNTTDINLADRLQGKLRECLR